ncbi:MAG: hypothetical protein LUE08_04505 [Akkermansiaceae bacterium]|nr:hypothetical protein [Akkermansiaceae bacterium]
MKRHDASLMLLLVAAANCRCSLSNDVTGDGASPHGGRTESIQIVEKPSGENSIWKSYCLQLRDFKKDIPGEFAQSPYIIEYKGQSILACPMKRETLVFLTARENDRLELIPLAVRRRPGLFTDQCRRMGLRPVRFVNGAWLRRENGRLVSDYSIACSSEKSSCSSDVIYLEFKGIFELDIQRGVLELKAVEGPLH